MYGIDVLRRLDGAALGGCQVIISEHAFNYRKEVIVEKLNRRRKRYRVRVRDVREPGAFWSVLNGGSYIVHPAIWEQLKEKTNVRVRS